MAGKKTSGPAGKAAGEKQVSAAKPAMAKPEKTLAAARPAAAPVAPAPVRKLAGPTARACPLVLDGEIDAADFSPSDCLTCSEFDCRFCEAEAGSGALRSRLFAGGGDDGEGDDEGFGGDFDFDGGEEAGEEEDEGEEDDPL